VAKLKIYRDDIIRVGVFICSAKAWAFYGFRIPALAFIPSLRYGDTGSVRAMSFHSLPEHFIMMKCKIEE